MIEGSCHCGAAGWRFAGVPESATTCNCSTCRRYGALWGYGYEQDEIEVSGETRTYVWGRRALEFHFCPACACVVCWREREAAADGRRYMGVNLRLAPPEAVRALPLVLHDTTTRDDLPPDGRCVADLWF